MSQEKTETKFEYWKIIIALLGVVIPSLALIFTRIDKSQEKIVSPKFSIEGSHSVTEESPFLTIIPANKSANQSKDLDLKIGNFKINEVCKLINTSNNAKWRLDIKNIESDIFKNKFQNGENEIQLGFAGEDLWDTHSIFISTNNLKNKVDDSNKEIIKKHPEPEKSTIDKNEINDSGKRTYKKQHKVKPLPIEEKDTLPSIISEQKLIFNIIICRRDLLDKIPSLEQHIRELVETRREGYQLELMDCKDYVPSNNEIMLKVEDKVAFSEESGLMPNYFLKGEIQVTYQNRNNNKKYYTLSIADDDKYSPDLFARIKLKVENELEEGITELIAK